MEIGWLTAFIDMPASGFDAGTRFWVDATGSELSPFRGSHDEFATLLPPDGDPYLRVQRLETGTARVHLDLHVASIPAARERALQLGAALVADHGYAVMSSPAGLTFCLVTHRGESARAMPRPDPPHLLDQLSIDVPQARFESECRFWGDLTGWEVSPGSLDEFASLSRPAGIPYRVLLQRLGADDPGTIARAHLDIACGDRIDEVAGLHEQLGAVRLGRRKYWVTMEDPVGLPYCLTPRDPRTGRVPG